MSSEVDELEQAAAELRQTEFSLLAGRKRGEPLFDAALLPTCPDCGSGYVPLDAGRGGMTTSHGACVGYAPVVPAPVPRRVSRAAAAARRKSEAEQIEAAAQLIYVAALENKTNFKASVWRIPMDKAGVPESIRRHAVVHAIRAGWIEALDLLSELPTPDLEQYDRRQTRWRSNVYVPLRRNRRRPTTNGPSQ